MIGNTIAGMLGVTPAVTSSYESIATATGTGSSGTITFSSIPSTYTHLQLRIMAKGTSTLGGYPTSANISINTDTTASNYTNHSQIGNGSTAIGNNAPSNTGNILVTAGSNGSWSSSSLFTVSILDFLDYANTNKYKTIRTLQGGDNNGAGQIRLDSMVWLNSAAINSISFTCDATYLTFFATNSSFALYGIKG